MTGAQNKWNIDVKKDNIKDSATVRILGYNYEITKTANKDNVSNFAEYGDNIQYTIAIKNTGSTKINNVEIEDIISSELENITISGKNWSSIGSNKYKYTGTIEAGGTETLKINAEIKADAIKESDDKILNTATISKVKNKKNIDITDKKTSTVEFKFLGYKIDLKKYIIGVSSDRSGWENTEKYNSPVVVKKGEHITYKIELKNNSETAELKEIKIEDILPDGLRYIEKGGNVSWKKAGNIYEYDGKVQKGDTITLEITAEVTMSNMYLFNIENVATTAQVLNKNKQNINDLTIVANQKANWKNKDYIRMDELDISGTVWNDKNADGLINNKEKGIPEIEVVLHNFDEGKDSIVSTVKTDSNGKYTFSKVQKGLIRESNGNYENKVGQGYKKYYIQYIYNGVTYQSTNYAGKENINANGTIKEDYKIDSNAAERTDLREEFNKSLETISYNKASDSEGNTKDLSYTKDGTISTLNLTESTQISAFSFVDTQQGYPSFDNLIWLGGSYSGSMSSNNVMENTDYLGYINLGLVKRETVDLELQNGIESFTETINGQELEYVRANIQESYTSHLYGQDYRYKYTDYTDETVQNMKTDLSELNIEVKYRTIITNNSNTLNAVVNEVTQYYDKNFKPVYDDNGKLYTQEMKIDSNNDGIFDENNKKYEFSVDYISVDKDGNQKSKGVAIVKTAYTFEDIQEKNTDEYQTIYITGLDNVILGPGESIIIYTKYIVDKEDENRNLKLEDKLDVISEINAYSIYKDTAKNEPAGAIDIDSNPGNLGETNETKSDKSKTTSITDKTYYEDDTSNTGITFQYPKNGSDDEYAYKRKITGVVWEDLVNSGKVVDGQKIGDGILQNSEEKVQNIKVELYEVVKDASGYKEILSSSEVRTNSDGNYTIEGFKPGMYIIRFTYGDRIDNIKYNGQDYKSATYNLDAENKEATNENINLLMQDTHYSDARDDEQKRLGVMQYSLEMYNKKAEILKGENSSDKSALIENTQMFADTPTFIARIENVENEVTNLKYSKTDNNSSYWYKNSIMDEAKIYIRNYSINNIDFGLEERPINNIELKKYIKEIKLETSAGDVLVDAKYDENSKLLDESKGTENLQALNNTETQQGFRYINVDEDVLQGAKITINYGFIVKNNSEVDHISTNLYGTKETIDILTTNKVKEKIENAINEKEKGISNKYTNSTDYYGYYLGEIYYKGKMKDDVVATIKVDTILDYVDNNLVFSPTDNGGAWGTSLATELIRKGYLKEDVYKFVQDDGSSIEMIADINGIEYQTDTKNNLAVTIDDPNLSKLSKQLYPVGKGESSASTELMVSTFLSSENKTDDMVYENIAEIIKFTTLTGRRTISAETVGNAKVNYAGYINSDATLAEPDTSIVEKVMLTPPTGLSEDENRTQTITRITIYVATLIALMILTILYAPKIIIKIKDRKFIK